VAPADRTRDRIADWLIERIAAATGASPDSISEDQAFMDVGLSSVQAIELSAELESWTGLTLSPTIAFDYPTIAAASEHVADEVERSGGSLGREPTGGEVAGA
jgi:myxalamid-type polyketide synthase MxaE and MxaD